MKENKLTLKDISKPSGQLVELNPEEFMKLPYPYDTPESQPSLKPLTDEVRGKYECDLDGHLAIEASPTKEQGRGRTTGQ